MSIIIFIIILAVLVLVHEIGHFIVAKKGGIRVDEFGMGLPPRACKLFRKNETDYTLNWIPFGGFVRIFGESPDEESLTGPDSKRSFVHKPKWIQASVLVAGVVFNMLFAYILIVAGFMIGLPTPADWQGLGEVTNPALVVTQVFEESPAAGSDIRVGDKVVAISADDQKISDPTSQELQSFIGAHQSVTISHKRGNDLIESTLIPESGIIDDRNAIGISMDMIGTLKLNPAEAVWEGAKTTVHLTKAIAVGLGIFIYQAFTGTADLSQVAGPVGIVGLVGDASDLGFVYLMTFTAFISIHLAIINLVPFPALDGGRLLFVILEAVFRKPIPPKVANSVNAIGFILLLLLMAVVTFNDVLKIIS